jgi:hypothetical protein
MCDSKQKSSYEDGSDFVLDFCLESHILSFPKVLQSPPESPCMYDISRLNIIRELVICIPPVVFNISWYMPEDGCI